jgi:transposase-like protein
LPKRLHRTAKAALHEIYEAETRRDAEAGIDTFASQFGDKYPQAVEKLVRDREALLTFYAFPAAHWTHLRTVNPISIRAKPELGSQISIASLHVWDSSVANNARTPRVTDIANISSWW